jgi:hypothetical protein
VARLKFISFTSAAAAPAKGRQKDKKMAIETVFNLVNDPASVNKKTGGWENVILENCLLLAGGKIDVVDPTKTAHFLSQGAHEPGRANKWIESGNFDPAKGWLTDPEEINAFLTAQAKSYTISRFK